MRFATARATRIESVFVGVLRNTTGASNAASYPLSWLALYRRRRVADVPGEVLASGGCGRVAVTGGKRYRVA